tara:strand:+ start:1007 stop:1414 length:408 start_codon:yes stop_codon:yes gene_type:complete
MLDFFLLRKKKLINFFIIGVALATINLLLIYSFVDILELNTPVLENISNIIAIEIGIILSFILNRHFTWPESKENDSFLNQIIRFHYVVGFSAVFRVFLFAILQFFGINYLINTIICIMLSSIFNFIFYDKKVFK